MHRDSHTNGAVQCKDAGRFPL